MKPLAPLVLAMGLGTQSAAFAVTTVSTPPPKAVLAVQQILESQMEQLGDNLSTNAQALDQAATDIERCNAELPDGQTADPEHASRYLECRQDALDKAQAIHEDTAKAFEAFAQGIDSVRGQVDSTIASNAKLADDYATRQRKVIFTINNAMKRAKSLAKSLPATGRPSREQLREMRRLASEIHYAKGLKMIVDQTLALLESNATRLTELKQSLDTWQDEAKSLAYDFHLKADLIGQMIEAGAAVGEAQVLISQFQSTDVSRIAAMVQRMRGFDFSGIHGPGVLPPTRVQPPGSFTTSDEELIQFFRNLASE